MEQNKIDRANEEQRNKDAGHPGDIDFQRMIQVSIFLLPLNDNGNFNAIHALL